MRLLARRDFLLIFGAVALSSIGDYLAITTLVLRLEETGSGWAVAALLLCELVPGVALAPVAGLVVDRVETVRVVVLSALVQAVIAAGLAASSALVPTLALALLLGTAHAFTQPALFALIPKAVGEDRVTEANGLLEAARWGGAAIGPALGALLRSTVGGRVTLLANAGTFLFVGALGPLLTVRRPPEPTPAGAPRPRGEARRGITHILGDPLLRVLVPMVGLMVVFAAADNVAEVFFAKDVLLAGDTGYGALVTTWTVGMVVGSTGAGRLLRGARLAPALPLTAMLGGGAVLLAAGVATLPVAVAMFLVGGIANGIDLVAMRSLLHQRVPDRLRGRAFAAYYAMIQAAQIVALGASGGLVEVAGARTTMLLAGSGTALVGLLGLVLYARVPVAERHRHPAAAEG
ncbi:MAG: MFS transporter [Actinomycetota bacterium]|nr:MFS transporter [Actinomycetota bacterium]